jgi:formaldehyde-activating enzyme
MTWGAAQLGIGQGVLDAVAGGVIEATGDLLVLVAVWVDPAADDETAVREANRTATRKAIGTCVEGRDPAAAAALVEQRDSLRNPFYGGE